MKHIKGIQANEQFSNVLEIPFVYVPLSSSVAFILSCNIHFPFVLSSPNLCKPSTYSPPYVNAVAQPQGSELLYEVNKFHAAPSAL